MGESWAWGEMAGAIDSMRLVRKRLSHQVTVSANHRSVCEACDQSEESLVSPDDHQGPGDR